MKSSVVHNNDGLGWKGWKKTSFVYVGNPLRRNIPYLFLIFRYLYWILLAVALCFFVELMLNILNEL